MLKALAKSLLRPWSFFRNKI